VGQSSPSHHAGGWHLTGTLGHFAASVAVGSLIGLNSEQMVYAMGIGATQASGMQQNRGTMCKSFHAGRAASNGLLAARLAKHGFNSSDEIVEGKRGFSRIYSIDSSPEHMVQGLGEHWEIENNGFKPYACGVVLHPAIDAMIHAHKSKRFANGIDRIKSIAVRVNPLVISITGTVAPSSGLHSKFSIYHSVCVAFIDGKAGIDQYSDARANDPTILQLKEKVIILGDETLARDQAKVVIEHEDGEEEFFIQHASGTVANPMSDQALEEKFLGNASLYLSPSRANEVVDLVWRFDEIKDASELMKLLA
jgi:2-methylcitrate dehydratase PrpD